MSEGEFLPVVLSADFLPLLPEPVSVFCQNLEKYVGKIWRLNIGTFLQIILFSLGLVKNIVEVRPRSSLQIFYKNSCRLATVSESTIADTDHAPIKQGDSTVPETEQANGVAQW